VSLLSPSDVAAWLMVLATAAGGLTGTIGLVAMIVPRWRATSAARLRIGSWVALACGTLGVLLLKLPPGMRLTGMGMVRVPSGTTDVLFALAAASLGLMFAVAIAGHVTWAASSDPSPGLRRAATVAVFAAIVPVALAVGPTCVGQAKINWWRARSPETPFGRVVRIELRVDETRVGDERIQAATVVTWIAPAIVQELAALTPWTGSGLGYATRCTEGSPFHLVFVTEAGRELDVILPVDDCASVEPAWRNHQAQWTVPELLTRVGELLAAEPVAQAYADQFDEDVREYCAPWLRWARDPWGTRDETEAEQ